MEQITLLLSGIQAKLKAPKNQFNNFGGYKYRSCEDILTAVKPLLNGAVLLLEDELVPVGNRYYIKATAMLMLGNEHISTTAWAREEESKKGMDAAQITGSVSSYARKYALNGMFLIDDSQDPDTQKPEEKKPEPKQEPKPSDKVAKAIQWIEDNGLTKQEAEAMMCEEITEKNLPKLKQVYKAWKDKASQEIVEPEAVQEATGPFVLCPDNQERPAAYCADGCPVAGCPNSK